MAEHEAKRQNIERFGDAFAHSRTRIDNLPVQVDVETSTRCNLRCMTCGKTYGKDKGADIERDLFDRLADAVFPSARAVNLTGFGEPMAAKHFEHFWQRSLDDGLHTGFVTNGGLFSEDWIERLATTRTHLFVSLDAVSTEVMKTMRPQLNLERLLTHLQMYRKLRERTSENDAHLMFNFVPTRANIDELPEVVRLAAEVGAERVEVLTFQVAGLPESVRSQHLRGEPDRARRAYDEARRLSADLDVPLILPPDVIGVETEDDLEALAESFDAPVRVQPHGFKYPFACSAPWFRTYVTLRGDVLPCCAYPHALGNLRDQTFEEIWNGEPYRKIRARINTRFPQYGCKTCWMVWGITAGDPAACFAREGFIDGIYTGAQRLRRRLR